MLTICLRLPYLSSFLLPYYLGTKLFYNHVIYILILQQNHFLIVNIHTRVWIIFLEMISVNDVGNKRL